MINSTDNNTENELPKSPAKPPKPKGPIRWGGILPAVIIVAIIVAYSILFFDSNLRWGLQKVGTKVNGAEVNVGSLVTSFFDGTLRISNIQVTQKSRPAHNRFQIGKVFFKFSWDALLRAKFVVENASIEDIKVGTKRKKKGYVVPKKDSVLKEVLESKELKTVTTESTGFIKEEFGGNIFGDAAALLEGENVATNIKDDLKSVKKIKEIEQALDDKELEWKQKIASLPKSEELSAIQSRLSGIKIKKPKDIKKALKTIKEVTRSVKGKLGAIKSIKADFKADMGYFKKSFQMISSSASQDYKDLEKRIQLPGLDTSSMAQKLFKKYIMSQLGPYQKYAYMAQDYLPKSSDKKSEKSKPDQLQKKRSVGKNYYFGTPKSYPFFWLQNLAITSKAEGSEFGVDFDGLAQDFTTNPKVLNKKAKVKMQANYPVTSLELVKSKTTQLIINKSKAHMNAKGNIWGSDLAITLLIQLKEVDYIVDAQSKLLKEVLRGAVNDVGVISIDSYINGTIFNPKLSIKSNLAKAIGSSLKKQLKKKISEAKLKLKKQLDEKIGGKKKALMAKFDKLTNSHKTKLNNAQKAVENIKNKAGSKVGEVKKQGKQKAVAPVKKKAKKKLKNLLKKFKF